MKIKNKVAYNKLMRIGKQGWGDLFERVVKELIEELEKEINGGKKLTVKLVKETCEKVQVEKIKTHLNYPFRKEVFILLGKAWEYGDLIEIWFNAKKL